MEWFCVKSVKAEYNILNPKFFLRHINTIASFIDEGFIFFSNRIRLVGIDPGRIAILELKMDSDIVETTNKNLLKAPINLDDFAKICKRFSNPEILKLIYDEPNNTIIIQGKIRNKKKTFKLSTIDIDESKLEDPLPSLSKIKFNSIFRISASDIKDALLDCEMYSEVFTLHANKKGIDISATGIIGSNNTLIQLEDEIYGDEKTEYSTSRVKKIVTPLIGTDILIMFKKDFPIAIYDKISEKSHMLYYLAPRIDNNE